MVLRGVDTLHVGFQGRLPRPFCERVDELVARVDGEDEGEVLEVAGRPWRVMRGARFARARLRSDEGTLLVGRDGLTNNPELTWEPENRTLWERGWRGAWERGRAIAQDVFRGTLRGDVLSRADLTVDLVGAGFGGSERSEWVSRATSGRRRGEWYSDPRDWSEAWSTHDEVNSLRWGGGSTVMGRAYDKSREVREKSGKVWLGDLWTKGQSDELGAGIREALRTSSVGVPVWRVEFQTRRKWLKELVATDPGGALEGLDSPDGFGRALPLAWRYLVGVPEGEAGWLSWRRPNGARRDRWPVRPEWRAVQAVDWSDGGGPTPEDAALFRRRARHASAARLLPQLVGGLTTYAALVGLVDVGELVDHLRAELEAAAARDGETWAERVRERAVTLNAEEFRELARTEAPSGEEAGAA